MPTIRVTEEAHQAVVRHGGVRGQGERQPDGTWAVWVDAEVLAALEKLAKHQGGTISDAILHLVAIEDGHAGHA